MGKLRNIKDRFSALEKNVNLATEKLGKFELLEEKFTALETKFNEIYDMFMTPDEEITPEQVKQQEDQALAQMESVIQSAIVKMVNKPENQKSIQDFAQGFAGAMSGKGGSGWEGIMTEGGEVNWGVAIQKFMDRNKGSTPSPPTTTRRRTTGY